MRVLSGRWAELTDFAEVIISQFSPVPGKPVSARINPKKLLAQLRIFPYSISSSRGRSSAGRALDWQSRGQGFDPPRLHHRECKGLQYYEGLFSCQNTSRRNPFHINKKLHNFFPCLYIVCWTNAIISVGRRSIWASGTSLITASTSITCINVNNIPKQPT